MGRDGRWATFSSFAVAFSYISPSTGIFPLFALGLTTLGGVFIWTWPVVALGQFIIALNFAEVSSHFPVAGSVFQWTSVRLITLIVITVLNIYGVRLVALINNTGVVFEILGMFVFALIMPAVYNHQGFHVVTNSGGLHVGSNTFLVAMFMSLFVIYGFDTASTLSEETKDPRRAAPRAVLFSIVGAFVIGGVLLLGTLMAIPNLGAAIKGGYGPAQIIEANFPHAIATIYLLIVSAAIFVCCLSIMAATIRLCFGMSRDNRLPFSRPLALVAPSLHTPSGAASRSPCSQHDAEADGRTARLPRRVPERHPDPVDGVCRHRDDRRGVLPDHGPPKGRGRDHRPLPGDVHLYGRVKVRSSHGGAGGTVARVRHGGGGRAGGRSMQAEQETLRGAAGDRPATSPGPQASPSGPQVTSPGPQARPAGQQARRPRLPSGSLARILPGSLARVPPQLVRGLGQTVHAQIEDWLAGAIAAGQLAPGDRLPAEHDLAAWLGVSRMTLRHALSELAQRGLVIRAVGRHGGTFVAEPKLDQDVTTLAGFSEQLRRHGMVAGARVLAAAQIQAGPAAAAALGLSVGDPVHEVRRIRLADGHPMVLEHSQFPAALFPGLLQCRLDGSLYELAENKFGQRPHRAKETFEPVIAGVREAEALEVDEGAPLMLVERTAYSRSGLPLEYARDLFRGDRTRVVIWTSELVGEL